jgi:hypothetical protein
MPRRPQKSVAPGYDEAVEVALVERLERAEQEPSRFDEFEREQTVSF